jgi:hypothetical protein
MTICDQILRTAFNFFMDLGDHGRVAPKTFVGGRNPNIGVIGETQIEKWAFYRENVHRKFKPSAPRNIIMGIITFIIIPWGLAKLSLIGLVCIFLNISDLKWLHVN